MESRQIQSRLRREFSVNGWALLIYYGLMNVAVSVAVAADVAVRVVSGILSGSSPESQLEDAVNAAASNGWGYLFAMAMGAALLYAWKKRKFCLETIWKKEKCITEGVFASLAALFFGIQAVAQVAASAMEWFFNLFGLSIAGSLEAATGIDDTVSMFLYAAVFAPIWEEILFRGLILRNLQPYGKKFAIVASAFLFGIFHANIIQTPYAFAVGLILGYVTVEYSIVWAMVLHMLNNMVLADLMTRLSQILPPGVGDLISLLFIWGCAIAGGVILVMKRHEAAAYIRCKKMHPLCLKSFFTSPGILILTVIMVFNMVLTFLLQLIV